jgi:hypothetical protein
MVGQRSQIARIGAETLHSKYDSKELTKAARAASDARFERAVDPEGKLDPVERRRRAVHARRAYMAKLALKSAQARAKWKAS